MLEAYMAYADYQAMMELTEQLVARVAEHALGSPRITYQGHEVDLTPPWDRLPLADAVREFAGVDILAHADLPCLQEQVHALQLRVDAPAATTWAKLVDAIVGEYVEPNLIKPTFLVEYPVELSPLAKRSPTRRRFVERFEPYVGGIELGNAFSELNDPLEQRERFQAQAQARVQGDEEAQVLDEDFVQALEYGMPPTGGLGIGIDRLTMLLCDTTSIREVILFPHLRRVQPSTPSTERAELDPAPAGSTLAEPLAEGGVAARSSGSASP
jgi:lysyl-tRNA synthetase class 2